MSDINVIHLTKEQLQKSLDKDSYWNDARLTPFSKNKAHWICQNNRIKNEDYCAVIAIEKNSIVGFIYLLPDIINTKGNSQKKVYWIVFWWVAKEYKSNVLATYLFSEALRLTENQVLVKSYAEHMAKFYKKMPFTTISSRLRYTIFFSLETSTLISRFKFLKHFKWAVKIANSTSKHIIAFLNTRKYNTKHLFYEYINQIDEPTWDLIKQTCKNDLIFKTKDYCNWHINPVQFVTTPINRLRNKALVHGNSTNITIHNIKILKENNLIGFISYIVNYNEVNVKYFLVKHASDYSECVDALMEHLVKHKTSFIFTDDSVLANNITDRFNSIFTYKINKEALIHNDVDFETKHAIIKNQDGHFY